MNPRYDKKVHRGYRVNVTYNYNIFVAVYDIRLLKAPGDTAKNTPFAPVPHDRTSP
jgi:hypothetical protein